MKIGDMTHQQLLDEYRTQSYLVSEENEPPHLFNELNAELLRRLNAGEPPKEYTHWPWCNGSRRKPAGEPGSSCCCFNKKAEEFVLRDAREPGPRCPSLRELKAYLFNEERWCDEHVEEFCAKFFPAERQEALGTCNLNGNPHQKTCGCIDWMSL